MSLSVSLGGPIFVTEFVISVQSVTPEVTNPTETELT